MSRTPPKPATFKSPDFILAHGREFDAVISTGCRTCFAIMWLIIGHSEFKTGWFLGTYHRFQALLTPPKPERGPQQKGPSLQEVRTAIDKLIAAGVLWRDASNLHNKQLKLRIWPRDVQTAAVDLTNSYSNRVEKRMNQAFMRPARRSKRETQQLSQQGYQQLNSIPPTPKKEGGCPQPEGKKAAQAQIAEILEDARRKGIIKSPPRGKGQTP